MPGAPLLTVADTYQGVTGEGVSSSPVSPGTGTTSTTRFLIWLLIIGVVLPVLILGGLRAGGFQFVYRRR